MLKRFLMLLFCGFVGQLTLQAQSKIYGNVTDSDLKEPLLGATIFIENTGKGTTSDINGYYELSLDKGSHTLVFSYVGYESVKKTIEVDGVSSDSLNIVFESGVVQQTIIVTDGKYAKKLEESTVSVDVITPQMFANNNITALDDVMKKVSGVQMMDGQVNIRGGSGYAYGAGSRVAFLVDGQQLLSAELSDVKWNFIPIENAEQIEVIKGSASVLYGSGALNGVINVRTAYPKAEPYTSFSTYTSVYDNPSVDSTRWFKFKDNPSNQPLQFGGFFAHRSKVNENFDLVLGGNFHMSNGFIQGLDERRFRFNINTRYRPAKAKGKISYGINSNIMFHDMKQYFLAKDMGTNAYVPIDGGGRDRYISWTIDPFYTAYDKWNNKHNFQGRWFLVTKPRGNQASIGQVFSGEYQFQRKWQNDLILTTGTMIQHFRANSILFNDNNTPGVDRALFFGSSIALYAQIDKKLWNKLSITAGVRWEGFLIDTIFTPAIPILRLGANYEINQRNFLRASFGQGYRFPSLVERFINEPIPTNGFNISIFPNPSIKPEFGWSSELAYRHTIKTKDFKIYADFALFWMEYKNMVEFTLGAYPEGLGFKSINVAKARIAGFELSTQGEGKIGNTFLRVWGGYTFSYTGDLTSDTTLNNVGKFLKASTHTFFHGINLQDYKEINRLLRYRSLHNFRMDMEAQFKKFTVGAVANFNSYVHRIDLLFALGIVPGLNEFRAAHNHGDWVFDLRAGYRFNPKQSISFVVANILNREYSLRPARMEAPRTFTLKYNHVF